jgi:hypothetical protein
MLLVNAIKPEPAFLLWLVSAWLLSVGTADQHKPPCLWPVSHNHAAYCRLASKETIKKLGSGRQEVFLQLQVRIPALEHYPKFLVQGFDSRLQQQMRLPLGPLHLLLLAETLADDLVDGRLDKTGAYTLPIPVALAIVGNEGAIAVNVRVEFFHGLQQFPGRAIARGGHGHIQVHREVSDFLERLIDVAMPQRRFESLQRLDDRVMQGVCLLLVMDRLGQTFRGLLHDGQTHRQMKPVQQVLGLRVQVQLQKSPAATPADMG